MRVKIKAMTETNRKTLLSFWMRTQYCTGRSTPCPILLRPRASRRERFTALPPCLSKSSASWKPDYIAAAYDLPKPTFRHIAYDKYKAGRAKMDDSLAKQINRSHDILKAFNIPVYSVEGFEADDVLGTIVENLKSQTSNLPAGKAGLKIIVASGDMDTLPARKKDDVVVYTLKKESTKRLFTTKKR